MCFYGEVGFDVEKFDCDLGFLFDIRYKVCNYEYAVDCGDRPRPGRTNTFLIFIVLAFTRVLPLLFIFFHTFIDGPFLAQLQFFIFW